MAQRRPSVRDVETLYDQGDVAGLVRLYGSTRRRDVRRAAVEALARLRASEALLDLLGDRDVQRQAAAALVEIDGTLLARVADLTAADDEVLRAGALYTVYYYARYRDMPEALDVLRGVASRNEPGDLAHAAAAMAKKAEIVNRERRDLIDKQLATIADCLQQEQFEPPGIVSRMYSSKRRDRLDAMRTIVSLRHAAIPRVIEQAPDYGDTVIAILLALGINEIGGAVVPPVAHALRHGDRRTRSVMLRALLCLRQARIPGAADALEDSGVTISETADRSAARVYREWVKD